MEAEYVAPCDCVKGSVWLRRVLRFMNAEQGEPTAIFEDNNSCIALARTKREGQAHRLEVSLYEIYGNSPTGAKAANRASVKKGVR